MNFNKIDSLLDRINLIYNSAKRDGTLSKIEKDILLDYMRNMYEALLQDEQGASSPKPNKVVHRQVEPIQEPTYFKEDVEEVVELVSTQEIIEEKPRLTSNEAFRAPMPEAKPHAAIPFVEEEKIKTPSQPAPKVKLVAEPDLDSDVSIEDLFQFSDGKELSDRLSQQPITDLKKAIPIGDKHLFIKELFGNNQEFYTQTIQALDTLQTFGEAKMYLLRVAINYHWNLSSKKEFAKNLIKIIRRRYI
jgi:hypothetical protein